MNNNMVSSQGTDNKKTVVRGYIAAAFTVISVLITIICCICIFKGSKGNSFGETLIGGLIVGAVLGGIIPGITHIKEIYNKIKNLLNIFPVGWAIFLILILSIPYLGGWVFMLIDLVKFLMLRKEGE